MGLSKHVKPERGGEGLRGSEEATRGPVTSKPGQLVRVGFEKVARLQKSSERGWTGTARRHGGLIELLVKRG